MVTKEVINLLTSAILEVTLGDICHGFASMFNCYGI